MKLADMVREGEWGAQELADYITHMERELAKFYPSHMAEVWRENQALKAEIDKMKESEAPNEHP